MTKIIRTKRHNQKIVYSGPGLYRWDKNKNKWVRVPSKIEQEYLQADDKTKFGLVKIFDCENTI